VEAKRGKKKGKEKQRRKRKNAGRMKKLYEENVKNWRWTGT
jgi:hypothetical protein